MYFVSKVDMSLICNLENSLLKTKSSLDVNTNNKLITTEIDENNLFLIVLLTRGLYRKGTSTINKNSGIYASYERADRNSRRIIERFL